MIETGIRLDPIWHSQVTITWGGFVYKGLITEWGAKCRESRRRVEKLRANASRALLAWRKEGELLKTRGSKSCATNVTQKRAITCCPRQLQVASPEQILWYHSLSLPSPAKAEINPINSQSLQELLGEFTQVSLLGRKQRYEIRERTWGHKRKIIQFRAFQTTEKVLLQWGVQF